MDIKIILIILILCLVTPISYISFNIFPPEGKKLIAASWDDALIITSMHSFLFNFENPWIIEKDFKNNLVFDNPGFGAVYLFIPLGIFSNIIGLGTINGFILFTFLGSLLAAISAYKLLSYLAKDRKEKINSLYLYFLSAGLGGIIYLVFTIITDPNSLFLPYTLRGFGIGFFINSGKLYYPVSMAFALFSILYTMKKRIVLSGAILGLTTLFYPMFGFATGIILLIYNLLSYDKIKAILISIKTVLIAIPITMPWLFFYFRSYDTFKLYVDTSSAGTVTFLPVLTLSLGLLSFFIFYFIYSKTNLKNKKVLFSFFILASIFSLSQLSNSYWTTHDEGLNLLFKNIGILPVLNIISNYTIVLETPFIIMLLYLFFQTFKYEKKEKKYKNQNFIISWFFIIFLMVIFSPSFVPWLPGKIVSFLWIPSVLIGLKGIKMVSKKYKINEKKIIYIIIFFSLPSIFIASVYIYTGPRTYFEYYTIPSEDEYKAMVFLKDQPKGIVLAPQKIGVLLPIVSNQKSVIGPYPQQLILNYEKKLNDSLLLFNPSKSTENEKTTIIKKYNITYIFINDTIDISSFENITEKIYEKGIVKVLKTN